jgi:protein-disulfide isomerase
MKQERWLILLVAAALLLAACGPQMATPTPAGQAVSDASPTAVPVSETTAPPAITEAPAQPTVSLADLPVDPNDWHALGASDAAVTLIEYSDFQ